MKKNRKVNLSSLIVLVLVIMFTSNAWAGLENGVPFNTSINSKTYANFSMVVPDGATGMTVSVTGGSGLLDLYLKYGSPLSASTVGELAADADIHSDGSGADETISITPTSTPALRAGTWYAAVLNLNASKTSFTITATIDTGVDHTVVFGSVGVGQTARKSIKISNPGTSERIITAVNITGPDAAMFWATPDCPTVPANGSHSVDITFNPTSTGAKSARLIISSNNKTYPTLTIALTGTGTGTATGEVLPLPTEKIDYPAYSPTIAAQTGIDPAVCKPIGVGNVAVDGDTVSIEIKLENPSGPYDAYLALQAPAIDQNEFFMLGQDGSFHPFSQSGLVKWKQSATGKINEKPFGDIPVSLLPGGAYNFNFILTPPDSLDTYYLWQTSFSAPVKPTPPPADIPDGSAGFFNGTLVVPNATIIYQGQSYEGSVPLPEDRIVGIKKDGQVYLYHPAMGVAELTKYNSRRAVGFFMLGVSASEAEAMRSQRFQTDGSNKPSRALRSASATVAKIIGVGQTVELGTGINLKLLDKTGKVKAINKARNFSVIKTGTAKSNKYFLSPRSNMIPSESYTMAEFVYKVCSGQLKGMPSTYSERSDIIASDKIETFRSVIRALPIYKWKGGWGAKQKEAMDNDTLLTIQVNAVDFVYCYLDMLKSIGGILPSDCIDLLVSSGLFRGLQSIFARVLEDPGLISQTDSDTIKSLISDSVGCIASLLTVHAAEAVNEVLDILSLFNWIVEDVAWRNFLAYFGADYDAYDLAYTGTGMIAYSAGTRENLRGKLVMHNLGDGSSWDINTINGPERYPKIVGITDNGTVVLFVNAGFGSDYDDQLIAVPDWGRGTAIDLLPSPRGELKKIDIHDAGLVDVTGSGGVFFEGQWYDNDSNHHNGICNIWINGERPPGHVHFDTKPYDSYGEPRLDPNALSISRDAQKLVFAERNNLYSTHHTGANWHLITSTGAPSYTEVEYVDVSDSGDLASFSYPTEWGNRETTVLYSAFLHSYEITNLTAATGLTTIFECARTSPDGKWIATIALDPSRPEGSKQQRRIVLIRPDDGYFQWLDTGNIYPIYDDAGTGTLCFTSDSKSIIFVGKDHTVATYTDIFAVDIAELHPNLRNLTNTPDVGEGSLVLR